MHILFVHKNFPAQFGHIAAHLIQEKGYRCTFVSETPAGMAGGIQKVQYKPIGGADQQSHYLTRTFDNATAHAAGVYAALKPLALRIRPDLIVGHSGFGSTLFLPELFPAAPVINYFEYFYHPHNSDMDFRPEWPVLEEDVLRARTRNAMILLDLEYCRAGYSPTEYQAGLLPAAYRPKLRVLHDGIDTSFWRRSAPAVPGERPAERVVGPHRFGPETRLVTYVSRGFESMRGFDIFLRAAKKIYTADPRVVFLIVGSDRVAYGGDLKFIRDKSFKDFVLKQDEYDLDRLLFLGQVKPAELARLLSLSDLHLYLTVPFVLSWSLLNALACGCTVLASDTAPVREFIRPGETGLLRNFFDVDGFAAAALQVLADPEAYRSLGEAGARLIREHYSLQTIIPRLTAFYEEVAGAA
ncbi:MAG: glycosyltransferase [Anaerolineales bacterium]|nr:glycosyltransferase [Anaerolineales bacterium]